MMKSLGVGFLREASEKVCLHTRRPGWRDGEDLLGAKQDGVRLRTAMLLVEQDSVGKNLRAGATQSVEETLAIMG